MTRPSGAQLLGGEAVGVGVQGMLGPQCAYLPELFGAQNRYTGVAVTREFSAIIAGGIAPFVGAALLQATGNAWWPLAAYTAVLSLITVLTTFVAPDDPGRDLLSTAGATALTGASRLAGVEQRTSSVHRTIDES